ncbi:MAG: putative glycosyl transferase [ANME-2 cluster archaeon HR1]|nr:MAG: putative glycosyl transferase [ANME-2 cluster archaeon HR1]
MNEGVPRTVLEAMSCGVPIVCTELPQFVSVVEGCGLLVPVEDSQALAEGILKIISDKELVRKLGENGRMKVVESYSWEDTVKNTVQLYEELI